MLNQRGYDGFAADVWSLGVCLFAMVSGFFPLDEATKKDWRYDKLLENQSKGRSTVRSVYGWYKRPSDHLTPALVDLLDNMLMMEPSKRASMAEVLAHPWLQGPTAAGGVDASGVAAGEGFDAAAQVGDGEAPQWRTGISVVGEGVPIDDAMEYDDPPVYRSLGEGRLRGPPPQARPPDRLRPRRRRARLPRPRRVLERRATDERRATTTISRQWTADSKIYSVARGGAGEARCVK